MKKFFYGLFIILFFGLGYGDMQGMDARPRRLRSILKDFQPAKSGVRKAKRKSPMSKATKKFIARPRSVTFADENDAQLVDERIIVIGSPERRAKQNRWAEICEQVPQAEHEAELEKIQERRSFVPVPQRRLQVIGVAQIPGLQPADLLVCEETLDSID